MSIRTVDEWQAEGADWITVSLVRVVDDDDGAETRECYELSCDRCDTFSCALSAADLEQELLSHRDCMVGTVAPDEFWTPGSTKGPGAYL